MSDHTINNFLDSNLSADEILEAINKDFDEAELYEPDYAAEPEQ